MTAGAGQNTQFMCMLVRTGTFPETSAGALHEPVTCESRPGITYVTRYLGAGLTSTVTRTGILKEQQRGRQSQTVIVISPCRLHYDAMSGLAPEEALTGMTRLVCGLRSGSCLQTEVNDEDKTLACRTLRVGGRERRKARFAEDSHAGARRCAASGWLQQLVGKAQPGFGFPDKGNFQNA
ncbi:hypothetical protein C0Q70_18700 [Pomacea canaliculata]|uniref:Uncharacterized protein n=1 Tax=Pomacea canaliculata TaxID=400727 RepID=A0A2T7NH91_POMCA|nr:hypothetical protein C0Q70_18700 [Pomacea canaliculata]